MPMCGGAERAGHLLALTSDPGTEPVPRPLSIARAAPVAQGCLSYRVFYFTVKKE